MKRNIYRPRIFCAKTGATAIEFAIIASVMLIFMVGFIEISLIYFTSSVLEGATSIGSRIGRTGFTQQGQSREAYIRSEIERLSGGFLDSDLLDISTLSYSSFENIGQPEPCIPAGDPAPCANGFVDINGNGQWDADQGANNAGGENAVVLYQAKYPWPVFTPFMREIIADAQGNYNITAVAVVKNEGFE